MGRRILLPLKGLVGVALCALSAYGAYAGPAVPWGAAYKAGVLQYDLTNRTSTGGICLDDADLTGDPDEIRFVSGELSVNHLEIQDRTITFRGHDDGTMLKQDPYAVRYCGGALTAVGGQVTVSNLVFTGFTVDFAGGALYLQEMTGDSSVIDCDFVDCQAVPTLGGAGGALYASADKTALQPPTLILCNTRFISCAAGQGGALATECIYPDDERAVCLDVSGCRFEDNESTYSGGALWIEGGASFSNTCFTCNRAGSDGGAVCVGSSVGDFAGVTIRCRAGVVFAGNEAHDTENNWGVGGALALMSGNIDLEVSRTAFLGNMAGVNGGAIFAATNATITVTTSIFSNNVLTVAGGYGGAVSAECSTLAMTNVTVRGSNGGAVDLYDTAAELVNCVVVDNGDLDVNSTGDAHASLVLRNSAYGMIAGYDPLCELSLAGRTAADFDGGSLYLRENPYNPLAAEGLVQDATDFDGVAYGSRLYGYSMGAFECATGSGISSEAFEGVYDGAGHTITVAQVTCVVTPQWIYSTSSEKGPWEAVNPAFTNVGTYTVWACASSSVFKTSMVTSNTVTITQRVVTVESMGGTWTYDAVVHSNEVVSVDGLVAGETVSTKTWVTIEDVGTTNNDFAVIWDGSADADNYRVVGITNALVVEKRTLSGVNDLYLDGTNFPYTAFNQGPVLTNEYVSIDGQLFSTNMFEFSGNTGTNVTGYTFRLVPTERYADNFEGAEIAVPWSISKVPLTVIINDHVVNQGQFFATNGLSYVGFLGSDTNTTSLTGELGFQFTSKDGLPGVWHLEDTTFARGFYTISPTNAFGCVDYEVTYSNGLLEVKGEYVVRYEPGCEASGTMPVEHWFWDVETNLTRNAFKPVNEALRFLGWVTNGLPVTAENVVYGDGQTGLVNLALPDQTNVLTAVWTTNYVVYGQIGGDYVGVSIQLAPVGEPDESNWYKGVVMGDPTTCTYTVETPFDGEYDLVADFLVTNHDVTVTNRVRVTRGVLISEYRTRADISAPTGLWNSEVNNDDSGDWPAIARGLDEIATNSIPPDAVRIEVELVVTDKPNVSEFNQEETNSWTLITKAAHTNDLDDICNPERVVKVFDLTVIKRTSYSNGTVITNYPGRKDDPEEIEHPLRVLIPFEMEGRTDFWVYRCHEGEEIPLDYRPGILDDPNDMTDDCWAFVAKMPPEKSYFVVQSSKFSMYGVGFRGAKVKGLGEPWLEWVYDSNSALYYGRFTLENYDGWPNTIENLTFHFPARTNETGAVVAQLYTMDQVPVESVTFDNRFSAVDTCEHESVSWGGDDDYYTVTSRRKGTLLYPDKSKFHFYLWMAKAYKPDVSNLLSQISYDSYGWTNRLTTISNRDLTLGRKLHLQVQKVGLALPLTKMTLSAYNSSIAVGAAVTEDSQPNCSLESFSISEGVVKGRVKVGSGDDVGTLGANAVVELLGASSLGGDFRSLGTVDCDVEGNFSCSPPEDVHFFRVRITVRSLVK